jgi:predicted nuclease of predicted toxin-antitoxin system
MKILIDMNLSPTWVAVFTKASIEAVHWSSIGPHNTPDSVILNWAKENGFWVFTNDLDFGAILAATKGESPSVFQVRTQDVMPESIGEVVLKTIRQFEQELKSGAIVTLNESRSKVSILPL